MAAAGVPKILLLLTWLRLTATCWTVAAQHDAEASPSATKGSYLPNPTPTPLFVFHGPVTSGPEAEQDAVVLHVLLKTKRRRDGAFVVRTVSYAERVELQGKEIPAVQVRTRLCRGRGATCTAKSIAVLALSKLFIHCCQLSSLPSSSQMLVCHFCAICPDKCHFLSVAVFRNYYPYFMQ